MPIISPYQPSYQPAIDATMAGIEKEFAEPISSPQSTKIYEVYQLPDQRFWVAMDGERAAGTIGLVLLSDNNAVLKRMMVGKEYRGSETRLAKRLLETTFSWALEKGVQRIYLGTMEQFKAAQRFYIREGAIEAPIRTMPSDMPLNPIDTMYYRFDLIQKSMMRD